MSIVSGLSDMLSDLENGITKIKDTFEKDSSSALKSLVTTTESNFRDFFNDVEQFTRNQGSAIEKDFSDIEKLFEDVAKKIEKTSEEAYHTFINKTENELSKIEKTSKDFLDEIGTSSNYIRKKASGEIRSAIDSTRKEFEEIKKAFTNEIEKISNDIIEKTKAAVNFVKNDASNDLEKLNSFRKSVEDDIEEKFRDVENVFSRVKNTAEKELDVISNLVGKEVKKLEERVGNMKDNLQKGAMYLGIAAVIVGLGGAIALIALKEKRYIDSKKKE